jgi:plasmid stabilization system protein ParE
VARVQLSPVAVDDLDHLVHSHGLPGDTRHRLVRSLRPLESFPRIGRELEGRWRGFRFIVGPWPWMLIVYDYAITEEVVTVVAIQDGRASTAATASPGR